MLEYVESLRNLEYLDSTRKSLIRLAVIRAHALKSAAEEAKAPQREESATDPQKKALDYERRFAALKMQLATKDQVHEAKIDGFKQLIARLQSQLEAQSQEPVKSAKKNGAFSSPGKFGASLFSPARPSTVFNYPSPFGDRAGKGNSFSVSGLNTSLASQASLKLSKKEEFFSPNNSSAETTPKKPGRALTLEDARLGSLSKELLRLLKGKEKVDEREEKERKDKVPPAAEGRLLSIAESSNILSEDESKHSVSEPEDTFQSANGTFEETKKKGKKKKIRLFSSEASKILVDLQSKINDEEISLNYNDDNFEDDLVSPTRPIKRPAERSEKSAKKRHVFKI